MAENKFAAALHQQFRVIGSKWAVEQVQFNSDDLTFKFKRNFPLDLASEAATAQALTGIISQETVLGTISIVKDVPEEMARIKAEWDEQIDLDKAFTDIPIQEDEQNGMQGEEGQREEMNTAGPAAESS
jgi:hypothetical protein